MQPDFNLYDAFRIFDDRNYGYITLPDFKYSLQDIGVYAPLEQLELFFKRYDRNRDGRLTYSEFCDALVPLDPYYARQVNYRRENGIRAPPYAKDDVFRYGTKLDFKDLLKAHFRAEDESEYQRQKLQRRPYFSVSEAFRTCDLNQTGTISKYELKDLIESKGLYINYRELDSLVENFDKNKDGRISFSEFMDEMLPKSPAKGY